MITPKVHRFWPLIVAAALLSWPGGADAKESRRRAGRCDACAWSMAISSPASCGSPVAPTSCGGKAPISRRRWTSISERSAAVHFPSPRERSKPKGEYCFELQGGDLLFGSLAGLTPKEAEVDSPRFGRLHIQRTRLERIVRWRDGEDLVYMGPNGLSEWDESGPDGAWRQEANHLATDQDGAHIAGDLRIPPQACIELELSWTKSPDFVLALGARGEDDKQAFRIETWDHGLACLWETEDEADLAMLQQTTDDAGRCRLVVYLDQPRRRAIVFSIDGTLLADVSVSDAKSEPRSGIYLLNRRGGLRIEQLRVRKCSGDMPQPAAGSKSHLSRTDGSIVFGKVERFDANKNEFVLVENGRETRIEAARVDSIVWSQSDGATSRDIHVCLQDGARFSGKLREVKGGRLWVDCPGVAEPLGVSVSDLQGLSVLNHSKPAGAGEGRQGRLEMADVRLHGCLVDGAELSPAWLSRVASPRQRRRRALSNRARPEELCIATRCHRRLPLRQTPEPSAARPPRPAAGVAHWVEVLAGGTSVPKCATTESRKPPAISTCARVTRSHAK